MDETWRLFVTIVVTAVLGPPMVYGIIRWVNWTEKPKKFNALEDAIDTSRKWRKGLMADWDRQFRKLSGEPEPGATRIENPWLAQLYFSQREGMVSWSSGGVTYTQRTPHGSLNGLENGCRCAACKKFYIYTMEKAGYPVSAYGSPFVEHKPPTPSELYSVADGEYVLHADRDSVWG